ARSKEELAAAVYERAIRWYDDNLTRHVRAGDPPLARLRGFIRVQLEAAEHLKHGMTFVNRELGGLKPRPKWRDWWRRLDRELAKIVAEGQTSGDLLRGIDSVVARRAFWAIV